MKKILFLINTLGGGGAEKILVETVNSLDHNKYDITVQTIFDEGVNKKYLSSQVRYKTMVSFRNKALRRMVGNLFLKVFGSRFLYKAFIRDDYDYEIAFLEGLPTKIISSSTSRTSRKYAWVHTDLNAYPDSYRAYRSEQKEGEAYKQFDKVFCVSESVKAAVQQKYAVEDIKLDVVYNIIDDQRIETEAKKEIELVIDRKPVFISVGRFMKAKGYERLLSIHKRLIQEGFEHTLLLIGNGEEYDKLKSFIADNHLLDTALLLGYQDNPYKYMSKADLFVCSSFAEGYSTVVSEAILCDTPVLSTDVAGAREPIDQPRCSVIVENSEEALYEGLRHLLENPEELKALQRDPEQRKSVLRKEHLLNSFEKKVFLER